MTDSSNGSIMYFINISGDVYGFECDDASDVIFWNPVLLFKGGASFCHCAHVLRISRWYEKLGFLKNGAY